METIATLSAADRRSLFTSVASDPRGVLPKPVAVDVVEKDAWVCFALQRIFSLYAAIRRRTIEITPRGRLEAALATDYAAMRSMFFDEPPTWAAVLANFESQRIRARTRLRRDPDAQGRPRRRRAVDRGAVPCRMVPASERRNAGAPPSHPRAVRAP
jgi:hypothetical protein